MKQSKTLKKKPSGVGYLINRIQTLFIGLLRIWTIPIVLMLSISSGFTTYYGLSHFITPWIALVITVAIQSIIVICSLEMAGIHWTANRLRYFSVMMSLLIAICASVSFSYFKFYEISQQDGIHINRLNQIRENVKVYLNEVIQIKAQVLQLQRQELEQASAAVSQAYMGTHPEMAKGYKHQVGEGPIWKHYNNIYLVKQQQQKELEQEFKKLDASINVLQQSMGA